MKGLITKVFAALLVGWYLMSIVGFGVHTCNGSGKSFVVAFYEGTSCSDIHPEHACGHTSCCPDTSETHVYCCCGHDETSVDEHQSCSSCDGVVITSKSCCSDDYQVLGFAGALSFDDQRGQDSSAGHHIIHAIALANGVDFRPYLRNDIKYIPEPDSGLAMPWNIRSLYGVWRI